MPSKPDQYAAMREYAFETQSFVISASAYVSDDVLEDFGEDDIGFNVASGGSMLVSPAGIVKEGPVIDEEALLKTTFDRDVRRATKAYFDAVGHYSRWDAVYLNISNGRLDPFDDSGEETQKLTLPESAIDEIVEEQDVSRDAVEAVLDAIHRRTT